MSRAQDGVTKCLVFSYKQYSHLRTWYHIFGISALKNYLNDLSIIKTVVNEFSFYPTNRLIN